MALIPHRTDWPVFAGFEDRMNRLLQEFLGGGSLLGTAPGGEGAAAGFFPPVDVVETPETLEVKLEIPGVDPKEIDIRVQDDRLLICGEKKWEEEKKGKTWYRKESRSGSFSRTVLLPARVDADRIQAVEKNGVLTLSMPKLEEAKSRRITVTSK